MAGASGDASLAALVEWLRRFQVLVAENRAYLTELDSAIGDADHGANLDRGMTAVVAVPPETPVPDLGELFRHAGMTLVRNVGGASGPLFGFLFLRLGTALAGAVEASPAELAVALRAGLGGVEGRGKAELGDKTMVDALAPAVEAFESVAAGGGSAADAARAALAAAESGRDATAALVARKGRASYLGERSVGHIDPGAASTALLFRALADALSEALSDPLSGA